LTHAPFFLAVYVNGFEQHDGSLKAINGSHLFRDHGSCRFFDGPNTHTNHRVEQEWCAGKVHPITGKPLEVEVLAVPRGSVVVMHTHAAHGVSPRKEGSGTSSRGRVCHFKSAHLHRTCPKIHTIMAVVEHDVPMNIST
jgi:hypothetical protein